MATELDRVRELVVPITSDLGLDLYDVERRGKTLRVTIAPQPGSDGGIGLDDLSLATRLISRELDHEDPITASYTLEVTSPGLERPLRTPAHFQREVGKDITVRLAGHAVAEGEQRRIDGALTAATETHATVTAADGTKHTVAIADVDKARTVFEWGPKPKPGKGTPHPRKGEKPKQGQQNSKQTQSTKEQQQ